MVVGEAVAASEQLLAERALRVFALVAAPPLQFGNDEIDDALKSLRPHDEGACPRTQKDPLHWSLSIFAHLLLERKRRQLPEALTAGTAVSSTASECRVENGGERYG